MATKRRYNDGCVGAHALDLVGERWALLVVRELLLGPKRFGELRIGLPGIGANVLSQRLDELEQAAVVRRSRLGPPANCWVYQLTDWGYGLEPLIIGLARWGARSPFLDRTARRSVDSLVLSFRALFKRQASLGLRATYELRFGPHRFAVVVDDGQFTVERGHAPQPDAIIDTDPATLASVVYGRRNLRDAIHTGDLRVLGSLPAAERFVTLFAFPEPAVVE